MGDGLAELNLDIFGGGGGVFHHIMQKRRGKRLGIQMPVRQNSCDGDGM